MIPKEPIRINKSFAFSETEINEEAAIPYIKVRGYASKMFDTNGKFVIDADSENVDTMGIDLSRLKDGSLPLLYGHDQSKPVGKLTKAEYLTDGLVIEATLYKLPGDEMTNFVYQSVKAGVLNSFSVGILVKDFDIIEQDGQDYLQLAKSEMIETSIVAVPSNPKATFGILEIKSMGDDKSTYKTIISKSILKAENPNACSEFEQCAIATKAVEAEKGLTYEETSKESWVKSQDFYKILDILQSTIVDNWYSEQYWSEISPEEALLNVKKTFESFVVDFEKLIMQDEDCDTTKGNEIDDLNLKGSEMANKDGSADTATTEETVKEEVTPSTDEAKETSTETKDEIVPEESTGNGETEKEEKPEADVEKKEETPAEVPVVDRTLSDLTTEADALEVSLLSSEDIEAIYESFSTVTEKIEEIIRSQVREELEEATPAA